MPFDSLLSQVEELQRVCVQLEHLAAEYPEVSTDLLAIGHSVRNSATLLAVVVATKLHQGDGHR